MTMRPTPQGFGPDTSERLPLPAADMMNEAQRAAAQMLIDGPRKGVKGPFVPLLRSPVLMERLAKVGEYLRFESALPARIGEFATLVVARHVSNQFEWAIHHPLALAAGTRAGTLDDLAAGSQCPRDMDESEAVACAFAGELLQHHGVSDPTYAAALALWGERGVVELSTLIGYFACVSWVMNVARTPAPATEGFSPLSALPR
ncbi:carboxymuconolactone decarboxylase family protein [Pseudothauera rhizosphaerae]|uniref:Carboxymuconolactone decarboxylase family protein n=1 Tax=Pseudothauera rhizosphaerae TaxID=2565932 RepID=A0A4S4A885_9RHOO|nr:carboxymuconolactone decarboxylase family protein [Pseudothauera rhizosphaerae]THF54985.1 carboxymuconolactone decarboxylase family protein [Pseudothauera rhizosphaerae]